MTRTCAWCGSKNGVIVYRESNYYCDMDCFRRHLNFAVQHSIEEKKKPEAEEKEEDTDSIELRDIFAGLAQFLFIHNSESMEQASLKAYEMADAMLKAREES